MFGRLAVNKQAKVQSMVPRSTELFNMVKCIATNAISHHGRHTAHIGSTANNNNKQIPTILVSIIYQQDVSD